MKKILLFCLCFGSVGLLLGLFRISGEEAEETLASPAGYLALTFDDGPFPETTETLLDGLAERGVKATFFLVGSQMEGMEDTVRRMADEGHQVGIHTWEHIQFATHSQAETAQQIERTGKAIQSILGPVSLMLRPPYGEVNETIRDCAHAPVICWSVDTEDWRDSNRERIVSAALSGAEDGAILLFHDIFPSSVAAALETADALLAEGYRLVTVEELFLLRGETPQKGQVYRTLPTR